MIAFTFQSSTSDASALHAPQRPTFVAVIALFLVGTLVNIVKVEGLGASDMCRPFPKEIQRVIGDPTMG